MRRAVAVVVPLLACFALMTVPAAVAFARPGAVPKSAHPGALHRFHPPIMKLNASQSSNWSGYNQGTLEKNNTLFHSISGNWTVPTATAHTKGQAEYSSSWVGIGGGCVNSGCSVTDPTLIQAGTEQDVAANGTASYSAWWELVPAPSVTISTISVHPGDHMNVSLSESVSGSDLWTMVVKNVTTGQSFSQTVPYPSTHLTAEWIQEAPTIIGSSGTGVGTLPNLSGANFDLATTNGAPAGLSPAEEIQLVSSSGTVDSTPSAPDPDTDGFNACTYATTCAAPSGS
jgi:Peptidase A4 family